MRIVACATKRSVTKPVWLVSLVPRGDVSISPIVRRLRTEHKGRMRTPDQLRVFHSHRLLLINFHVNLGIATLLHLRDPILMYGVRSMSALKVGLQLV